MNNLDRQYKEILEHIIRFGVDKKDRTGTGIKSIFGWQIRHNMKEGFPLLTTKKIHFKSVVTELLWFLRGDTNIKYLVDNDCHIWDGDAYKKWVNTVYYNVQLKEEFESASLGETVTYDKFLRDRFINKIKTDDEFAKKWGELGPIYGKQWKNWNGKPEQITDYKGGEINPYFCDCQERIEDGNSKVRKKNEGIDQIQNLINDLKTNPDSRRMLVSAWNPAELDSMVLPPCHYRFQVYTRELTFEERWELSKKHGYTGKDTVIPTSDETINMVNVRLEVNSMWDDPSFNGNVPKRAISLMWNQRSVDTFLGLPFNIASYSLLLEIIAIEVNMVPEELIGNLGDVHLYNNHIDQAKEQITRTPYELPKLLCKDEYWYLKDIGIPFTEKIDKFKSDFFELENYQSHPVIKAPLSN